MTGKARTVRGAGVDLAVWESGPADAPTVVLLHGFPDDHHVWDGVVEVLAKRHHVVTYDVRGVGQSDRPRRVEEYRLRLLAADTRAVIDATCPERKVHLIGHDWGSIQGWETATDDDHGTRLATYQSISGPCLDHVGHKLRRGGMISSQTLRSWYVYAFQLPGLPERFFHSELAKRLWPIIVRRTEGLEAEMSPTFGDDAANGVNLYRANVMRCLRHPRDRFAKVPVNVLAPRGDRYVTPRTARAAEPWCKDFSFREIDGSHWVVRKDPARIAGLFADFIADHPALFAEVLLQPGDRAAPPGRHRVEEFPPVVEPGGLDRPHPLAAVARAADHPRAFQDGQVLGDRLPGDGLVLGEVGGRERPLARQPRHDVEPGLVAEREEERRRRPGERALSPRHDGRSAAPGWPSPRGCRGARGRAAPAGARRSRSRGS